ncbi:MAG: glycosyltransferase family 2 protein [Pseudomonadota bacterium]
MNLPQVSVLIPTFEQSRFIARALDSLLAQSLCDWEAIIVDDGSRDDTPGAVRPYLEDRRIRYMRLAHNSGLGNAINVAMAHAAAPLLAYLPSDDVYYRDHLQQLADALQGQSDAMLAYAGVRHHYNRYAVGQVEGAPLQLVQCMHRNTGTRWVTREELESDDLERLFWQRLRGEGAFVGTSAVSCEWVDHPAQRHKIMQEPLGGINPFRLFYRVSEPLIFHTTTGNAIDERGQYHAMRERAPTPRAAQGLKILLVGELAYNAERVLALEEDGHQLYGLWMRDPYWYNTVGPLPFGHVEDLAYKRWREEIARVRPDVIYALLNWQAVPFAHEVMMATPGVPFVWHFKEGPFICLEKGTWPQLIDLFQHADGRIFSSPEMRDWFDSVIPGLSQSRLCHVLDGDLPKRDWFDVPRTARLSEADGEVHTVVPGRPIGLHPHTVAELAAQGVHLHFYGDFTHGQWRAWIDKSRALAPRHLHLHANVDQSRWVAEFSRYDAGWLHAFASDNAGELRRANWDDLNYPARMATLALAGLPMIQRANAGALVATQTLARTLGCGVFYDSIPELAASLRDADAMQAARAAAWDQRALFTFDAHVPKLVRFFRRVIEHAGAGPRGSR